MSPVASDSTVYIQEFSPTLAVLVRQVDLSVSLALPLESSTPDRDAREAALNMPSSSGSLCTGAEKQQLGITFACYY